MMLRDFYNQAHCNDLSSSNSLSQGLRPSGLLSLRPLLTKLKEIPGVLTQWGLETLSVLEVGVGTNPSFELLTQMLEREIFYQGVDFSQAAIDFCQKFYSNTNERNFLNLSAQEPWTDKIMASNLIVDAHTLHCLVEDESRRCYLANVVDHLKTGGVFLFESAIAGKHSVGELTGERLENGFYFQQIQNQWIATRRLKSAFELEQEILQSSLRIIYFQIPWGLRLQLNPKRALAIFDPEVVHVIAQKI